MSRFHPASLVDPSNHPQQLLDFLELDAHNRSLIGKSVYQLTGPARSPPRLYTR